MNLKISSKKKETIFSISECILSNKNPEEILVDLFFRADNKFFFIRISISIFVLLFILKETDSKMTLITVNVMHNSAFWKKTKILLPFIASSKSFPDISGLTSRTILLIISKKRIRKTLIL